METSVEVLRRQARLLTALLDQAERAIGNGNWRQAAEALAIFGERLQQRIEMAENSVLPWIERRVQDASFPLIARLHLQHASLVECTGQAISAVRHHRATSAVVRLRTLLDALVAEEDQVLWPLASQLPA